MVLFFLVVGSQGLDFIITNSLSSPVTRPDDDRQDTKSTELFVYLFVAVSIDAAADRYFKEEQWIKPLASRVESR